MLKTPKLDIMLNKGIGIGFEWGKKYFPTLFFLTRSLFLVAIYQ